MLCGQIPYHLSTHPPTLGCWYSLEGSVGMVGMSSFCESPNRKCFTSET